jgi:integrase
MQSLFEVSDEYVRRKLRFCAELTRRKYRRVCNRFGEFLGRTPVVSDLQTETVLDFLAWIHHERRQSAHTTNEARAKLVALWNYAAKQHLTTVFPDVSKLPAPERLPVAWTVSDFQALLRAAAQLKGQVAGMPAADWWTALLLLGWATGERRTALLSFGWSDFRGPDRIVARAETRKGRDRDRLYELPPWCLAAVRKLPRVAAQLLPWDRSEGTYFNEFARLLKVAGLPNDRWHKTHALRRSHASHLAAAGVDASKCLGHSTPQVTYTHYLDPGIVGADTNAQLLPDPTRGLSGVDQDQHLASSDPAADRGTAGHREGVAAA